MQCVKSTFTLIGISSMYPSCIAESLFKLIQHILRFPFEVLTCIRELYLPFVPLKQQYTQLILQLFDLTSQRWLSQVYYFGCFPEAKRL